MDGLNGKKQAEYFSKVRRFMDTVASKRNVEVGQDCSDAEILEELKSDKEQKEQQPVDMYKEGWYQVGSD